MISPMKSNFWDPENGDFHRERCKTGTGFGSDDAGFPFSNVT